MKRVREVLRRAIEVIKGSVKVQIITGLVVTTSIVGATGLVIANRGNSENGSGKSEIVRKEEEKPNTTKPKEESKEEEKEKPGVEEEKKDEGKEEGQAPVEGDKGQAEGQGTSPKPTPPKGNPEPIIIPPPTPTAPGPKPTPEPPKPTPETPKPTPPPVVVEEKAKAPNGYQGGLMINWDLTNAVNARLGRNKNSIAIVDTVGQKVALGGDIVEVQDEVYGSLGGNAPSNYNQIHKVHHSTSNSNSIETLTNASRGIEDPLNMNLPMLNHNIRYDKVFVIYDGTTNKLVRVVTTFYK